MSNGRMARGWQRRLELPCGFVHHARSGREMAGDERASLKSHLANVIIDREHHPELPGCAQDDVEKTLNSRQLSPLGEDSGESKFQSWISRLCDL